MTLSTSTASKPADATMAGGRRNSTAATLALARTEAGRLLRHPAVLIATVAVLALWEVPRLTGSFDRFPELHQADAALALNLLLIAIGGLFAANLAVLRSFRHGADDVYDVLALSPWQRTLAHLLALLPLAFAVGLLSAARIGQLALQPGAIGHPSPLVLAAGPAVVLLFGATGILLGSLVRSAVAIPLVAAFVVFFLLLGPLQVLPSRLVRLGPTFAGENSPEPQLPELLDRPAAVHLSYLLALVVLLSAVALLRRGAPRLPAVAVTILAAVLTIAAGASQFTGQPSTELTTRRSIAEERPAIMQQCQPRATITYCAFPVFLPRIEAWNKVATAVTRRIPRESASSPFVVRQRAVTARSNPPADWGTSEGPRAGAFLGSWQADDARAGTPDPLSVGTEWGNGDSELNFAAHIAYRMVTRTSPTTEFQVICGGAGTVTGWLAGQATSTTRTAAQFNKAQGNVGQVFTSAPTGAQIEVGGREVDLAYALLDQPDERVVQVLTRSWSELTSAKTTIERTAEIFGLPAPAPLPPVAPGEESIFGSCP